MEFVTLGVGTPSSLTSLLLTGLDVSPDPSGLSVKKLTFQKPATTTGVQTVTGVGFRGVALLIWSDRQTAAGVTDAAQFSVGMTDGATQVTRFIHLPDDEASTTSAQSERTNRLVYLTSATSGATPTVQVEGEFVGFTADGFEIDWVTNDAAATLFHVLVIGGVQANLVSPKLDVDTGDTLAVTGVGFTPEAFVVIGGTADEFGTGDYNFGAPFGSVHGFGFSNGTDDMCGWTLGRGTGGAADSYRGQHTDRAASVRTANLAGAGELVAFQITAIGADGFTMTRLSPGQDASRPVQHVLCLRGARFEMGAFDTPAEAGTVTLEVTGTPRAVLLQTHGLAAAEGAGLGLAIGAWQGATEGGTWVGGTDAANPSEYARATYTDATLKAYTPAATGASSTLEVEATVESVSGSEVAIAFSTVPASPVEILYLTIAQGSEPQPGGEVPAAVDPPAAEVPTGILRYFFTLEVGGEILASAETSLRDDADYFGGYKPGRLISVSSFDRELAREGELRGVELEVVLEDLSHTFRALADSDTITTAYAALYLVSDEVRYAEGEPYRRFAGRVTDHEALDGGLFRVRLRDIVSDEIADLDTTPLVPNGRLSLDQFPGMDAAADGKSPQMLIGHLTDETEATPQGVVAPMILGSLNFSTAWGGIDKNVIACAWSIGACAPNTYAPTYYNEPDAPDVRIPIPESFWGVAGWMPGKPGWSATGLTDLFVDYPLPLSTDTRRYTPLFIDAAHPLAAAFLEGRVIAAGNLWGLTENADGSGLYYSDPPRIVQWLLVNQLLVPYTTGDYADIPTMDGVYSVVNTTLVERCRTRQHARRTGGYPIGLLLGRNGQPQTYRHVAHEICLGTDMQQGLDRHGRWFVDTEDAEAEPVVDLTDVRDFEAGSFSVKVDRAWWFNRIEYFYGFRYVAPSAPRATPAEGEAVPERIAPYS
jgi:hypothetical protein